MRISVRVCDDLVEHARTATGARTTTGLIKMALERLVVPVSDTVSATVSDIGHGETSDKPATPDKAVPAVSDSPLQATVPPPMVDTEAVENAALDLDMPPMPKRRWRITVRDPRLIPEECKIDGSPSLRLMGLYLDARAEAGEKAEIPGALVQV